MTVSERIMSLISASGLKASEISAKTGIDQASFTRWKQKDYKPSIEAIIALSQFFDITTDYLLLGKGDDHSVLSHDTQELIDTYDKLDSQGKTIVKAKAFEELRHLAEKAEK